MGKWTTILVIVIVLVTAGVTAAIEPTAEIVTLKGAMHLPAAFVSAGLIVAMAAAAWFLGRRLDDNGSLPLLKDAGGRTESVLQRVRLVSAAIVTAPIVLLIFDALVAGQILDGLQESISLAIGSTGATLATQIAMAAYSLVMAVLAIDLFIAPIQGIKAQNDALTTTSISFAKQARDNVAEMLASVGSVLADESFVESDGEALYERVTIADGRIKTLPIMLQALSLRDEDRSSIQEPLDKIVATSAKLSEALRFMAYYSADNRSGGKTLAKKVKNDAYHVPTLASELNVHLGKIFEATGLQKTNDFEKAYLQRASESWDGFKKRVDCIYRLPQVTSGK
jgi:hypothetical protein